MELPGAATLLIRFAEIGGVEALAPLPSGQSSVPETLRRAPPGRQAQTRPARRSAILDASVGESMAGQHGRQTWSASYPTA